MNSDSQDTPAVGRHSRQITRWPLHPVCSVGRAHTAACSFMITLLFLAFGSSQAMARDVKVSGMGVRKCAEWQQWKEEKSGEPRAMVLEWTQGFIAGHNVYARSGTEPANSVIADTKILIPLLDSYCQKNPDSRILSGVVEITQSLGGAKINLAPKTPSSQPPRKQNKGEFES
jgi:hypothetical protein